MIEYGPFLGEALTGTHKPRFREILDVTRGYLRGTRSRGEVWDITRLRRPPYVPRRTLYDETIRRVDYCRFIDTLKG